VFRDYYAALLPRRGRIMRRTLSVCPSVPLSCVTSRHLANYNDTRTFRHAPRAAYRTAISAAQILVKNCFVVAASYQFLLV